MSQSQELRDNRGYLIGKIIQKHDGSFEGRDANGYVKGTYDPKKNETRDSRGYMAGKGNLLSSLIVVPK